MDGYKVTLMGHVMRPTLKGDAEGVVKGIEGAENVSNQIEVLPLRRTTIACGSRCIVQFTALVHCSAMLCRCLSPSAS